MGGGSLVREEIGDGGDLDYGRGQTRQGLVGHVEYLRFYPKCNG